MEMYRNKEVVFYKLYSQFIHRTTVDVGHLSFNGLFRRNKGRMSFYVRIGKYYYKNISPYSLFIYLIYEYRKHENK